MQPAPIKETAVDSSSFFTRVWIRWFQLIESAVRSSVIETVILDSTDSPYTVSEYGLNILCNTAAGAITVNFPPGVQEASFRVVNVGTAGNLVTIDGNGSELIGGSLTKTLANGIVYEARFDETHGWR